MGGKQPTQEFALFDDSDEGFELEGTPATSVPPDASAKPEKASPEPSLIIDDEVLEGTSAAGVKRSIRMNRALSHDDMTLGNKRQLVIYAARESTQAGGFASVANRIYRRQTKLVVKAVNEQADNEDEGNYDNPAVDKDMPKRTMFAIIREIREYVQQVRLGRSGVQFLGQLIEGYHGDKAEKASELPFLKNRAYLHEGLVQQAIVQLKSSDDAERLARGETEELPDFTSYFTKDPEVLKALDELIDSFSIAMLEQKLKVVDQRLHNRGKYFVRQLEETDKYGLKNNFAAIAARKALEVLHLREPDAA